jgi:hypothetical protein
VAAFVEQCRVIYHFAGVNRGEPNEVLAVNALASANIASACSAFGDRHVVFASSIHVERFPDSPYSRGKRAAEESFANMAGRRGCSATMLRMSNVYGVGCLPFNVSVIATFCWYKANGRASEMPIHGDGMDARAFVPIENVLEVLLAAGNDTTGLRLLEVPGTLMTIRQLADVVSDERAWSEFPVIGDMVRFFRQATPLASVVDHDTSHEWSSLGAKELTLPAYSRAVRLGAEPTFVGWLGGQAALDIYETTGEYIQTVLLEGDPAVLQQLPASHEGRIRAAGAHEARVRIFTRIPAVAGGAS